MGPIRRLCAVVLVPVRAILVQQLGLVWFWLVLVLFGDFCGFERFPVPGYNRQPAVI